MATKTKAVDADVDTFMFKSDLTIEPALPATTSAKFSSSTGCISLKHTKDEDVKIVDGQMVIVSNEVTTLKDEKAWGIWSYSVYNEFKKEIAAVVKLAKDAGSKVNGRILVRDDNNLFFGIKVADNTVTVEAARLGWSDGTTEPFPDLD